MRIYEKFIYEGDIIVAIDSSDVCYCNECIFCYSGNYCYEEARKTFGGCNKNGIEVSYVKEENLIKL